MKTLILLLVTIISLTSTAQEIEIRHKKIGPVDCSVSYYRYDNSFRYVCIKFKNLCDCSPDSTNRFCITDSLVLIEMINYLDAASNAKFDTNYRDIGFNHTFSISGVRKRAKNKLGIAYFKTFIVISQMKETEEDDRGDILTGVAGGMTIITRKEARALSKWLYAQLFFLRENK